MPDLASIQNFINNIDVPVLLLLGLTAVICFHFGKLAKYVKLPSIIGYMLLGVILGPSFFNFFSEPIQNQLSFLPDLALGFVALSIGLELSFREIKKQGTGIIAVILTESFFAFIVVFTAIYLFTDNLPLALIFGAIAPASAPAGTVAVIREYKARGNLTKALYSVVGFDDGLGILIFGFSSAIAKDLLVQQTGGSQDIIKMLMVPVKEIIFSIGIGGLMAVIFSIIAKKLKQSNDFLIHIFGFVLIMTGISHILHTSTILTNMTAGLVIVNTSQHKLREAIHTELRQVLPLLFILFFTLAGASLHIKALPSLGLLGIIYILSRTGGLISGSRLGALFGRVDPKIKNYLGLGILSQAGVAIGLSLIVKQEFKGLGKIVDKAAGITTGDQIGAMILTTITATCIIFELIGPVLTKTALKKAGEINDSR